jgi:dihydroorotate dehydrogenase (NAD+) catalytic subunit
MIDSRVHVGDIDLDTPLLAAAGTFGSGFEFADIARLDAYGAVVAKSVSREPWTGRPAPRIAGTEVGMLNGIGIQNPGIAEWVASVAPRALQLDVPVWGSVVGRTPDEFAMVATAMEQAGVPVVEVNLSCPNLEDHAIIALDPTRSREVVEHVKAAVSIPVGAKLSPNASDIVAIAGAVVESGAGFLTLTNTVKGAAIDITSRRPVLTGTTGGYSGPALKPIALACVLEVHEAMPAVPIIGCGGVRVGRDVVEYLLAGASAVALGTIHFAEPKAATRILKEAHEVAERVGARSFSELTGGVQRW